ncbi:hypothetical protein PaecuDRAFT_1516 [Paenibacillus curdlanolyticus YK9]|uniref:Uncharacterized protein n=1 Tax=Paenibacillus curdlanolyticus YK9 TaxID=717606 RepID=E0I792_9BACL|nr:hypothetical protein [Paenibacillus curdlanolyticus]EFM11908.1 hypothetical protein PaecuDRAFT_1516 [Paenibacillus curdlanolyticus YK9]
MEFNELPGSGQVWLHMRQPSSTFLSIVTGRSGAAVSRRTPVLLTQLSVTGVRFMTYLRFPVDSSYKVNLHIAFREWEFGLLGRITMRQREDNMFMYACAIDPDPAIQQALAGAMLDLVRSADPDDRELQSIFWRISG